MHLYRTAKPRPVKSAMWCMSLQTHKHRCHDNRFVSWISNKRQTKQTDVFIYSFFSDLEKFLILEVFTCLLCMNLHALAVKGCEFRQFSLSSSDPAMVDVPGGLSVQLCWWTGLSQPGLFDFMSPITDDVMTLFHPSVCTDRTRRARSVWATWRGCSTSWSAGWGSPCW